MPVDKFGRSPTTSQTNVTNVSGVSLGYVNNIFLRKGQAIDMNRKLLRISAHRRVQRTQ